MKKIILFFVILLSINTFAQVGKGGTAVEGLIPFSISNVGSLKGNSVQTFAVTGFASAGTPTGTSPEVGNTAGQLSVSLTGAATYSIPIATAPGINGVEPQISLNYNSQSGNGTAGFGWNISGISSITKIASTKYHDNNTDPVDFDNLDRYALDGQRLIMKTGSSYGVNGAVYETENYSNIKITSYGVHPSGASYGPAYFIVQYPDGSIAHFGNTSGNSSNSRSLTDWSITYWQNAQGVRINYNYTLSNNSLYIASIKYGALTTGTTINTINFNYGSRLKTEQAYIGGLSFSRSLKLNSIDVIGNGVTIRNYALAYDTSSIYERLANITEKNSENKSYNPTVFNYDTTAETISCLPVTTTLTGFQSSTGFGANFQNMNSVSGDFNGDGEMDFILYPSIGAQTKKMYWYFDDVTAVGTNEGYLHNVGDFSEIFPVSRLYQNPSGKSELVQEQGWCVVKEIGDSTTFQTYSSHDIYSIAQQELKTFNFPKYDQMTITTRCLVYPSQDTYVDCYREDHTYYPIPKKYINGDFNGDGISDVLAIEYDAALGSPAQNYIGSTYLVLLDRRLTSNFVSTVGTINLKSTNTLIVDDVNGDGKSDLLVFDNQSVKVYTLNNANMLQLLWTTSNTAILPNSYPILMGDYNGDGKSDFITPNGIGTSYTKFLSSGTGFVISPQTYDIPYTNNTGGSCPNTYYIIPTDFNHDGKTDLIQAQNYACNSANGYIKVTNYSNTGTNFVSTSTVTSPTLAGISNWAIPVFLNTNKQNCKSEINFITNKSIIHFESTKDFGSDRLLRSITLGNGLKEVINYSGLEYQIGYQTDYSHHYFPTTTKMSYPDYDIKGSYDFKVVFSLEKITPTDYMKQDYGYYGAIANVEGLGFRGFKSLSHTNWYNDNNPAITQVSKNAIMPRGTGITTETFTNETYTLLGNIAPFYDYSPISYIHKSSITFTAELFSNKVYKPKNTFAVNTNGLEGTSIETTTTYKPNNEVWTVNVVTKNANVIEKSESITFDYDDITNGNNLFIGRLKSKTTSVTHNGDTMTGEENYIYHPTSYLLSQIKKKGHLTNELTEDYLYDTFGNMIQKKATATDVTTPRVFSYTYKTQAPYYGRFLTQSTDLELLQTNYDYNTSNGLLISETLPSKSPSYLLKTIFGYDGWGKKITTTDYLGKIYQTKYTNSTTLGFFDVENIGADDSYTKDTYDLLGRLSESNKKEISGIISKISYSYDIYNRNVMVTEPFTHVSNLATRTYFDVYGRPKTIVSATDKTTTFTYTGLLTETSDGLKIVKSTKNAMGNVVLLEDNGGEITYSYYANGNLKETNYGATPATAILIEQDGWGRKTKLTDPSAGVYKYSYNDFGELKSEISQEGTSGQATTSYTYNDAGKIREKTIVGPLTNSKTTYTYDPTNKLLTDSKYSDFVNSSVTDYHYGYDDYKRLNFNDESSGKYYFQQATQFDVLGRPEKLLYTAINPSDMKRSDKWVKNTYKYGYPWQIWDYSSTTMLWEATATNERGQLKTATLGNGITLTNDYDQYGFVKEIKYTKSTSTIMKLNTAFDPKIGTLSSRSNSMFSTNEILKHDGQDRLLQWNKAQVQLESVNFDSGIGGFSTGKYVSGTSPNGFPILSANVSMSNENGMLKAIGQVVEGRISKSLLTKAKIGDKLSISFIVDKGTSSAVKIYIIESNPATGENIETLKTDVGTASIILFDHIVTQCPIITLIIEGGSLNRTNPAAYYVDNLSVKYTPVENQVYDDSGRILENENGQYEYFTGKVYQNKAVTLNPEAIAYYNLREGIFYDTMESNQGWSDLGIGWEIFATPSMLSYDTSKANTGTKSLKINNPTSTLKSIHTDKWIPIDNKVTTSYTFSGWIYSNSPTASIYLFMKTDNETAYNTQVDYVTTNVIGQWKYIEKTFPVPANIKKLNLRLDNNGLGIVWFDDVKIRKTDDPVIGVDRRLDITYNAFKSPAEIKEPGSGNISFEYNTNNDRSTMYYGNLDLNKTLRPFIKSYSADGAMEIKRNTVTGTVEFITYIGGDAYSAPVVLKSDGATQEYLYLHRDYQGSIVAISNQLGNVVEKRLFDPWGNILKVQDGAGNTLNGLTVLDRGYTGHEHLQSVGLINMNARLYDAKLHRFLQPDNYIQDPYNTQNYNRYGYVMNSPTKYTDYSGETIDGAGDTGCENCNGWGAFFYNAGMTVASNWESIKWGAHKYLNKNNIQKGLNRAGHSFERFMGNLSEGLGNLMGGKDSAPIASTPSFSNYQLSNGWQNEGFVNKGTTSGIVYKDGSAFFTNEVEGYQYMVNKSNMDQKNAIENYGYITKEGIAILPNSGYDRWGDKFQNHSLHAEHNVLGYLWRGYGNDFKVNFHGRTLHPIAWIHTHPDLFGGFGQSRGDTDMTRMFGIPSVVLGRDSVWYQSVDMAKKYKSGYEVMSINELLSGKIPLIYNILKLRK